MLFDQFRWKCLKVLFSLSLAVDANSKLGCLSFVHGLFCSNLLKWSMVPYSEGMPYSQILDQPKKLVMGTML
jgi:hypothetical protein